MYMTLFSIAGVAMIGWLLLILLPTFRVTRWIAERAVFPIFLSIIYLAGIVPLFARLGPGMMRDFGNAEGVLRLLAMPDVALVAWIHILAFDQAVALWIYRDNMRERWLPLPVQSVVLFTTLMFGPVGLLAYLALRGLSRSRRTAHAEPAETTPTVDRISARDGVVTAARLAVSRAMALYRRERVLTALALLGIVLGMGCAAAIVVRGGEFVAPEGHLQKAMTFDIAVGIYLLTLILFLPLARFSARGLMAWRTANVVLVAYAFALENVQIARGLDPRFTRAGAVADQILGGVFFLTAVGLIVLFAVQAWKILRRRMDGADGALLLSLRYAAVATFGAAFASGLWMSTVAGSRVGEGSILPLHAIGFHGLQALPVVAILLTWAGMDGARTRGLVHAAGLAWLAACAGIAWQTVAGRPVLEPSPGMVVAAGALLAWACVAVIAGRAWLRADAAAPARSVLPAT
ncbi:ABA4-like family protein [Longimicrobium terrae]|uniref:Uncharacterized membrane protein YidH (DUF202 family) n=1 Tax=Longimicrobium terrae TaxID=1639882 RepID=A0A841GY69_9BACT|nr:ABA4-like family protein [Longimicrobium terrae]MBB4636298.1 uncharacterized membrane protein YidH (DUF202 family) [Longimicrobium terrae]MBB6070694.1 uncharacterized membrane protein YidH (DUF202 family) [Longimicrobium terrae]